MPDPVVILDCWQVASSEGPFVCRQEHVLAIIEGQIHSARIPLSFQRVDTRLFNVELKPFGYGELILRIEYGDVVLGIPVSDVAIIITLNTVFIFDDGPYLNLGDAELQQHLVLVKAFCINHRILHLGLDHLTTFEVIGRCLKTYDGFFAYTVRFILIIHDTFICHPLSFWLENLQTTFDAVNYFEITVDEVIVHRGLMV